MVFTSRLEFTTGALDSFFMKRMALLFALLFICSALSALDLEDVVGRERAAALLAGEKPVNAQFGNSMVPGLVPNNDISRAFLSAIQNDLNPSIIVETLNIYRKPEGGRALSQAELTALYNELLKLSSLTGIQYYSASRDSMRIFYESSFIVDGPSSRNRIPDPHHARPPGELTLYARQRDSTFGENNYQYNYYLYPGLMIFTQENLNTLTYGILPLISRNNLRSVVALIDTDDHIVVYAASMARAASFPGVRERISNSFSNRAEAVFLWFSDRANAAWAR